MFLFFSLIVLGERTEMSAVEVERVEGPPDPGLTLQSLRFFLAWKRPRY